MIDYLVGDLFQDIDDYNCPVVIPHIVNDIGVIGGGFTKPLIKRWNNVKKLYTTWYNARVEKNTWKNFVLGEVQFVDIWEEFSTEPIIVANMIAQHNLISKINPHPIKYAALAQCMSKVRDYIINRWKDQKIRIVAPTFGTGLAGGNPVIIKALIEELWTIPDVNVDIYSLESPNPLQNV